MFEDNAKKILKHLLKTEKIDKQILYDFGFMQGDIDNLYDDREMMCIYYNIDDYMDKLRYDRVVMFVLGDNWKEKYEYIEKNRNGNRYDLSIKISQGEHDMFSKIIREIP